jgi:tRNA (adenine37-N6)-methyltransferase
MPIRAAPEVQPRGTTVTPPVDIRVLTAGDLTLLSALLALFGRAFDDPEAFDANPPSDLYLQGLLQGDLLVAIAARRGEELIGGLVGYVLPKYEEASQELYIYDLAVAEPHRRAGVATALIGEACRLAGRRGIAGIYVQAGREDEPAVALYNKLGRKAEVLHFDFEPQIEDAGTVPSPRGERGTTPVAPTVTMMPIGTVRAVRQQPDDDFWGGSVSEIELDPSLSPESLVGLEAFSHVEVVYVFDRVRADQVTTGARRPRGNPAWPEVGIFAQRAKNRPNRIGITICRVVSVSGRVLRVAELDAIDGTPVIDLKPVMQEFLPRQAIRQPAWASELMQAYWSTPDPGERGRD